jgi:hypothetical protein
MNIQPASLRTRPRRTATPRPTRAAHRRTISAWMPQIDERVDPAEARATVEIRRWVEIMGVPFVLAAVFFGAAINSGQQWLMGPAVVLGPTLMIIALVYVMLSHDGNTDGGR